MAAGRSSTGISPRPMLMGVPRNALRAFNAGVSLSCLRVLAHRLPHLFCGLMFVALLFGRGPVLRTCNRVMAHRPTGSTQTDRIRLPYTAPGSPIGLSLSRCGAQHGKGNTRHSIPGSAQVKIQDRDNQLCFQPAAQFFIHIGIRAAMSIIACPGGKRSYVTGIVADYHIYRVRFTPDSGGDYRIRKQGRPCACRFNHLHHLPSAPSATDRLFACGH